MLRCEMLGELLKTKTKNSTREMEYKEAICQEVLSVTLKAPKGTVHKLTW